MTQNTYDQFQIPSQRAIIPELSSTPEITAEDALRAALAAAPETTNPFTIDQSRVEFGARAIQTAVREQPAAPVEPEYFDIEDPMQLLRVGQSVVSMRDAAKAA